MLSSASYKQHSTSSKSAGTHQTSGFEQKRAILLGTRKTNSAYDNISDYTMLELDGAEDTLISGMVGNGVIIHKPGTGQLIIKNGIGENSTIILTDGSATINGSIGKGCTIKKYGSGTLTINGSIDATVKFKLDKCKLTFAQRPPQAVISNIQSTSECEIIIPPEANTSNPLYRLTDSIYHWFFNTPVTNTALPIARPIEIIDPSLEGPPGGLKWKKY